MNVVVELGRLHCRTAALLACRNNLLLPELNLLIRSRVLKHRLLVVTRLGLLLTLAWVTGFRCSELLLDVVKALEQAPSIVPFDKPELLLKCSAILEAVNRGPGFMSS